jgi:hypothetical protein
MKLHVSSRAHTPPLFLACLFNDTISLFFSSPLPKKSGSKVQWKTKKQQTQTRKILREVETKKKGDVDEGIAANTVTQGGE